MEDSFKITTEINGQTVKAECRVNLARFCYMTMTAPYNGIKTRIVAVNEDGIRNFRDRKEVEEYAIRELETIMSQIKRVKQHLSEYTAAADFFQETWSNRYSEFRATNASRQRGCLALQSEVYNQVNEEYADVIYQLLHTQDKQYVINPDLLVQILKLI